METVEICLWETKWKDGRKGGREGDRQGEWKKILRLERKEDGHQGKMFSGLPWGISNTECSVSVIILIPGSGAKIL